MTRRSVIALAVGLVLVVASGVAVMNAGDNDPTSEVRTSGRPARATTTSTATPLGAEETTTTVVVPSPPSTSTTALPTTTTSPRSTTTTAPTLLGKIPMAMPIEIERGTDGRLWVVGSDPVGGIVAQSGDGGLTWTWTCAAWRPRAVSVIGPKVIALAPGPDGLLVSNDGGRSFSPKRFDLAFRTVVDMEFVDERRGWIAGTVATNDPNGVIATTTDGGESWVTQTFPGVDITALWVDDDGSRAFAVGTRGNLPPVVIASSAAGWSTTEITNVAQLYGVAARGSTVIAAGASHPSPDGSALVGPSMVISEDGGRSWREITSSPRGSLWEVAFTDSAVWVGGQVDTVAAAVVSRDGGSTWAVAYRASGPGGAYTELVADGEHVAVVGYQHGAAFSDDGGMSWREARIAYTPSC